jgi:hypothetical protein
MFCSKRSVTVVTRNECGEPLASCEADLDPPGRHLSVFLVADEVDLADLD